MNIIFHPDALLRLLNQIRVFGVKRTAYYAGYINTKYFAKLRDKVKDLMDITPSRKRKGNGHASKKLPKSLNVEIGSIIPQENKHVK